MSRITWTSRPTTPATGDYIKTLFSEHNDKYIEPQWPMRFIPGRDKEFVWQTRRDGYTHLYRYNVDGKLLGQITRGEWEITDFSALLTAVRPSSTAPRS